MEKFKAFLSVVAGAAVLIAAAFGVESLWQPSEEWRLVIYAIASIILGYYNRIKPAP